MFQSICRRVSAAVLMLALWGAAETSTALPVLCFSDLTSGPRTGNSDTSLGQREGEDGAIVTIWGKNLGTAQADSRVFVNGAEARVYAWGNATAPADLHVRHHMQIISFQINHLARDGAGEIYAVVNGHQSNPLPFTVRVEQMGLCW